MKNVLLIAATIISMLCALSFQSFAQLQPPPRERQEIDLSPRLMPPPPGPTAPKVTAFSINNTAPKTTSRRVTLNNLYLTSGGAAYYRASEKRVFSDSSWQPYSSAPAFQLSSGDGQKTVYFQIKNKNEVVSNIASDTIVLAELKIFKPALGEVYDYAKGQGYTFTAAANDPNSDCRIERSKANNILILRTNGRLQTFGAKCTYAIFNKSLHEGWKYKFDNKEITCHPTRGNGDCIFIERPSDGGRNITYKLRGWCGAVTPSLSDRSGCFCGINFHFITLEGPADGKWQDAFK